jgi:hypothetical protein
MLWDMKFSPAKEKAAASEFDVLEFVVGGLAVGATLDKLVVDKLFCFLVTDSWRLLASAFSCWRMNAAKL